MPRGSELLVAQIAIAKTGAAWLPFDADAPVERVAVCLADAGADAAAHRAALAAAGRAARSAVPRRQPAELVDAHDAQPVDARALGARPITPPT